MNVLFVFAHQDDEVAAAGSIIHHVRAGDAVHCVYLTDGETSTVAAETRNVETRRALRSLGVEECNIAFLGQRSGIGNGHLVEKLDEADRALAHHVRANLGGEVHRLYILTWEGGHHDHDAAHLVGLALAADNGIAEETRQISLYHGEGVPGRFFRVMSPLREDLTETLRISLPDALRCVLLLRCFPSQRTTWLGLSPGTVFRYLILRRMRLIRTSFRAVSDAPHAGTLLYERMGRIRYRDFRRMAASFMKKRVESHAEHRRGAGLPVPNSAPNAI